MTLTPWLCAGLWGTAAAGLAWYCAAIAQQITYVTLADGQRQVRSLPLIVRLILPLAPNLTPFFLRPAFQPTREKLHQQLTSAGLDDVLKPAEFLAMRVLMPLVIGPLWILFTKAAMAANTAPFIHKFDMALTLIGPLWLAAYPGMWLASAIQKRHRSIRKALPFVLDLMTLSVESGMDFMSALQRNVEKRRLDPLGEELIRVVRQIQLGKTRREALRDMSVRVGLTDLRSVVNALIQADELGVSIGSILRIQADQIRQSRFERAERLANEAPVKMLFPLLFFIFPAVFLILLGPVMVRLINQGF